MIITQAHPSFVREHMQSKENMQQFASLLADVPLPVLLESPW